MIIKGFFFDLDGTLVNTHEANFLAYQSAVESIKSVTLGPELLVSIQAGGNSNAFLLKLLPSLSLDEVKAINQKKKDLYPQYVHASKLNTYLSIFLQQMAEHHVTALVTTAKRQNAMAVLSQHNLEKYFSFMVFGEDVSNMKPDPEAYLTALQRAGLEPAEVLSFEDSLQGIQAAEAAGITVVHIKDFVC